LSPLLKARAGSRHGYDITDHSSLNPEIAGAEDFEQFAAALKRRGMGQIMDVVPNHMGVMGADNGWWLDVLENGQASRFAGYFDIDWHPLTGDLDGRVLLPVLGDHYGAVLEQGELELRFDAEQGASACSITSIGFRSIRANTRASWRTNWNGCGAHRRAGRGVAGIPIADHRLRPSAGA
jgi:maltooligosyltrehalose synthase